MNKRIGLIIKFDDIDYSEEERNLLLGRFALLLAVVAKNIKEKKNAE